MDELVLFDAGCADDRAPGRFTVRLRGALHGRAATAASSQLCALLAPGGVARLAVDMGDVSSVDLVAVHALAGVADIAAGCGTTLELQHVSALLAELVQSDSGSEVDPAV